MSEFDQFDINENITVKFKINEYHTVAQIYSRNLTVHSILSDIADKFQVNPKYVQIMHESQTIPPDLKLFELCHNEYQIIDFELRLNELANQFNDSVCNEIDKIQLDCDVYYR